jgi:hypothetical protein
MLFPASDTSGMGHKRTLTLALVMSAFGWKADIDVGVSDVRSWAEGGHDVRRSDPPLTAKDSRQEMLEFDPRRITDSSGGENARICD